MLGAHDLAAELGELVLEGGGQADAVGLLVVDDVGLLGLHLLPRVLAVEGALHLVGGRGAEVGGELADALVLLPVLALGEVGCGVRRGDQREVVLLGDLLHGLGDTGVERADDAEDVLVAGELGGVLLADVGQGLVVEGFELEGDAVDFAGFVGVVDGELGGVADAQAEGGELPGGGGVEADDDGRLGAVAALVVVASGAARGEREGACGDRGGEDEQGTVTHDQSFPWRGHCCRMAVRAPGCTGPHVVRARSAPGGAVTGGDSRGVFGALAVALTRM